jgi:hypothetical protein
LTVHEERFALEYVFDLNGTQAMLRANPALGRASAAVQASRMLRRANVADRIKKMFAERAHRLSITADEVLARLWAIATADVRELVSIHVDPCPACSTATSAASPEQSNAPRGPRPDPGCSECFGSGTPRAVFTDTRSLSFEAACLYAGVRTHKNGIEVLLQNRLAALELVGRHLGLWGILHEKRMAAGPDPLTQLLKEIAEDHGRTRDHSAQSSDPAGASPEGTPVPSKRTIVPSQWRAVSPSNNVSRTVNRS